MIIIHGSSMYGKCDHLPGLFYVLTRFGHIYYVPLLPLRSYLILDQQQGGPGFSGVPIGINGKSILLAWLRLVMGISILVLTVLGVRSAVEGMAGKGTWPECIAMLVAVALLVYLFAATYRWAKASPARALRLAEKAGIDPEIVIRYFEYVASGAATDEDGHASSPQEENATSVEEHSQLRPE